MRLLAIKVAKEIEKKQQKRDCPRSLYLLPLCFSPRLVWRPQRKFNRNLGAVATSVQRLIIGEFNAKATRTPPQAKRLVLAMRG